MKRGHCGKRALITEALAILACMAGFSCGGEKQIETQSVSVQVFEPPGVIEDIDWTPVAPDYDARMFMVYRVVVDGKAANLLGFHKPSIDRCFGFAEGGYEPFRMAVINVQSRHNSRLFIMSKNKRVFGLLVSDTQAPAFSGEITCEEMWRHEKEFVELTPGVVYMEPSFWDRLKERGVQLPKRYEPIREIHWDSQKRQRVSGG